MANVSSVPKFECRPQTVDSALLCHCCPVTRPPIVGARITRAQHPEPLNDQIIFKARISRQLTMTNLSTVGINDCCLDNSSPSGHVTAQTVVLAKQAAASLQHRSTGRVAGTPRFPHIGFFSFQSSYIFHFVPHFAPPFLVHTKKAQR